MVPVRLRERNGSVLEYAAKQSRRGFEDEVEFAKIGSSTDPVRLGR